MAYGFIHSDMEIKLLILYIASRLTAPAPFEVLQEIAMCDGGVGYFDFTNCLEDLVATEHLRLDEAGNYAVTEKGRENGAICEEDLPYTVRQEAARRLNRYNQHMRRQSLVRAEIRPGPEGERLVVLSFRDELTPLMRLTLTVTREEQAKTIEKNYLLHAEEIYTRLLGMLCTEEKPEKDAAGN